jgi:site-specific DNA recombinase
MSKNIERGGKFKAREIYVLSGLIFCNACGSPMYGNSRKCGRNKTRYISYRCSNRDNQQGCKNKELRKEYVENFVLDELYNNLFSDSSIKNLSVMLAEYSNKQADENREDLNLATAELQTVLTKIGTVVKLVSETGLSIETVKGELKQLEDRKIYLEKYIRELTLQKTESLITEDMILELIIQSKDFVKTKNLAECRHFIKTYINKVGVDDEKVEVLFNISILNGTQDDIEPIKTANGTKIIQREYYRAMQTV